MFPFGLTYDGITLSGTEREIAKIKYNFSGKEAEVRIAEYTYKKGSEELKLELNYIDYGYNEIDEKEYQTREARIKFTGKELDLALLEIDSDLNLISKKEYDKRHATLCNEPWVSVIDDSFSKELGYSMELDYNDVFITELKENGFTGHNNDELVDQWFNEICRQVLTENGTLEDMTITKENKNGKIKYK